MELGDQARARLSSSTRNAARPRCFLSCCRSLVRWRVLWLQGALVADELDPEGLLLLAAIDELPPTYREVLRLRDIQEHSNAEVAKELRISKQNAAVRLHRAHRLLRARLLAHR